MVSFYELHVSIMNEDRGKIYFYEQRLLVIAALCPYSPVHYKMQISWNKRAHFKRAWYRVETKKWAPLKVIVNTNWFFKLDSIG